MATASALLATIVLAGCVTDVTSEGAPDFDLDIGAESGTSEGKADSASTQVVLLEFGGVRVRQGDCSDARSNCSNLVVGTQDLAPFAVSSEWDRGKVVAAITRCVGMFFTDMDTRFVTTRPSSGDYTMIVVGGIHASQLGFPDGAGPYGRAPVDCGNRNRNDVGFLVLEDDVNPDFYFMCRSIAHEVAHTFGMVHTLGDNAVAGDRVDVMCESEACRNAAASGQAKWDTLNRAMETEVDACSGSSRQNTYGDMMQVLGVH